MGRQEKDESLDKKTEIKKRLLVCLVNIFCFIKGHDFISVYTLDNSDVFEGQWRSSWGEHQCMRCGKVKSWQWDRY